GPSSATEIRDSAAAELFRRPRTISDNPGEQIARGPRCANAGRGVAPLFHPCRNFGHPVTDIQSWTIPGSNGRVSTMEISNFKNMFLAELQEIASVEDQLADALLRMAAAASHPALKRALIHHRAETETQKLRLETIL